MAKSRPETAGGASRLPSIPRHEERGADLKRWSRAAVLFATVALLVAWSFLLDERRSPEPLVTMGSADLPEGHVAPGAGAPKLAASLRSRTSRKPGAPLAASADFLRPGEDVGARDRPDLYRIGDARSTIRRSR